MACGLFKVITLGCRTNQYESLAYKHQLQAMGWKEADDRVEDVDLVIVNTCTVTAQADKSSVTEIRRIHQKYPNAKIVTTGCAVQKNPKQFEALEGVSQVVSNMEKESLVDQIFPDLKVPEFAMQYFDSQTRAFLKVQDGCNSYCSYCVIPFVRGRSRSRALESVLAEAKKVVSEGFKEIVLTGINIGDFDGGNEKNPSTLAELVRAVDAIEGLKRLRISSIDPDEVDDDLLDAVINAKTTCPSMHIVLQSGSNSILQRMRRKYTKQIFIDTVRRLKEQMPNFTVTTDIIVGFPGETEEDHKDSCDLVKKISFAKVHVFPYSDREKTRASRFADKVSDQDKKRRRNELLKIADESARKERERYLGKELKVLLEQKLDDGMIKGYSENFLQVKVDSEGLRTNDIVLVKCIENLEDSLFGQVQEVLV